MTNLLRLLRALVLGLASLGLIAAAMPAPAVSAADQPAAAAVPERPTEAAERFVAPFAGDHLSGMLSKIGGRQPPLMALSQLHGPLVAAVFNAEIDLAVKRHGPAWQDNLARAWSGLLSPEQLDSLADEGGASPHAAAYSEAAPEASARMQAISGDLFAGIMREVIDATVAELTAPPAE